MYQRVGVFLSSKSNLPASYETAAREVGQMLGRTGRTLVYGGCRKGLMEVLAKAVKSAGGKVYGMVPDIIEARGLVSEQIDVEFRCVDLNDRKAMMNSESEVLVALPGGLGTLDEVFTVLAAGIIGTQKRFLIFFNVDNCWGSLLAALDDLRAQGLLTDAPEEHYAVVQSVSELEALLDKGN